MWKPTSLRRPDAPRLLAAAGLLFFLFAGCDQSGEDLPDCALVVDQSFTQSIAVLEPGASIVAFFDLQQDRRTYAAEDCRRTEEDVDEVALVIRNVTNCRLSLDYLVSVFVPGSGWTIEGATVIAHGAARDEGVIQEGGVRLDEAQVIVEADVIRSECR